MHKIHLATLYLLFSLVTLLVVLTRGNPAFVKRRIALGILILSITLPGAALVSCRPGASTRTQATDVWATAGWVDDDTLRVLATGSPDAGIDNLVRRKASARKNALRIAQSRVTQILDASGSVPPHRDPDRDARVDCYEMMPVDHNRVLRGLSHAGVIVAERCNADVTSCDILYEVKAHQLRKKAGAR